MDNTVKHHQECIQCLAAGLASIEDLRPLRPSSAKHLLSCAGCQEALVLAYALAHSVPTATETGPRRQFTPTS